MRVAERDDVGVRGPEPLVGGGRELAGGGGLRRPVGPEPAGGPAGEGVAGVAGEAHAVEAGHERGAEDRLETVREPFGRAAGGAVAVTVGNIQGAPTAPRLPDVDDADAELALEKVDVPRVPVADDVDDLGPAVGPLGEEPDEAGGPLRDEVPVLDVLVVDVAEEHERRPALGARVGDDPALVRPEQGDGVALGGAGLGARAAAEVEVGEEEEQAVRG